jgi:thiamine-phosphate pyrophosphorylase
VSVADYTPHFSTHTLNSVLRYAITSRALFHGDDRRRQAALVEQAARWAADRIDVIQLREKDLSAGALVELARNILKNIGLAGSQTKLLINSRPDIAVAAGAHGVHLTASPDEITPFQVRGLYADASLPAPAITCSCHTVAEVERARDNRVDAILFAPVFGKSVAGEIVSGGQGLDKLRAACRKAAPVPVYALGCVTSANADDCLKAGASGIAGIRLFHTL